MIEAEEVCLKLPFLATLLPSLLFANGAFIGSAHHLCHRGMRGMCCSLLHTCYCQEANWAPRVYFDFCCGEMPLNLFSNYFAAPLPKPCGVWVNFIQSVYPIPRRANKNNPFKIMQLALIAMQLRIFTLLPSMQNPSHFIEVQKVRHYNSISTYRS